MNVSGDFNARVGQIPGMEGNVPDLNANTPLFESFLQNLNLVVLNSLPITRGLFTHFMERPGSPPSESVLDYGLIDDSHVDLVSTFVIDADARIDCGSDHALLVATVNVEGGVRVSARFHDQFSFRLPKDNNYDNFNRSALSLLSRISLHDFEKLSVEDQHKHIVECLTDACHTHFSPPPRQRYKRRVNRLPDHIVQQMKALRVLRVESRLLRKQSQRDPNLQALSSSIQKIVKCQQQRVEVCFYMFLKLFQYSFILVST